MDTKVSQPIYQEALAINETYSPWQKAIIATEISIWPSK